jgi:hypothetical protein
MFRDMHGSRNKQLARLHERLARDLLKQRMDNTDRWGLVRISNAGLVICTRGGCG